MSRLVEGIAYLVMAEYNANREVRDRIDHLILALADPPVLSLQVSDQVTWLIETCSLATLRRALDGSS